jgi:hypothetical protein
MRTRLGWLLVILALVLAGCSDGDSEEGGDDASPAAEADTTEAGEADGDVEPTEDPGDSVVAYLTAAGRGQFGRMWDQLHPAQQAVIDRDTYVDCQEERTTAVDIEEIEVVETFEDEIAIAGTDERTQTTAVTVRVEWSIGAQDFSGTETINLAAVDGEWRAFFSSELLEDCSLSE